MSRASDKRRFYCLPVAAITDARLTAMDHRILGVVALHDGMSGIKGGGGGCYASYKTLTDIVGCDYTNFGRSVSKLIQLGYLSRDPQVLDKRKFTLRVLYPGLDSCQPDQLSNGNPAKVVGSPDNNFPEIVGHENFETRSNLPETDEHYIPLNGELDVAEARKKTPLNGATLEFPKNDNGNEIDSAEAGLGKESLRAALPASFETLDCAAQVACVERAFKPYQGNADLIDSKERGEIATLLWTIHDAFHDEAIGQQANRLYEELAVY